jgi:hypothetical protein
MSDQDPKVILRYPNQSGAIIEVFESPGATRTFYTARCTACFDDKNPEMLAVVRKWAQSHSEICRALPQPEPADQ